jgi:hypothetical protein
MNAYRFKNKPAAMIVLGIFYEVASGLVLGLFAFIVSKLVKSKPTVI